MTPNNRGSRRRAAAAFVFGGFCPGAAALRVMHKATPLPQSPEELLERLFSIFPEYRAVRRPLHDDAPTFHSVLIEFSTFFGGPACSMSERQLRSLGELVSAATEAGGALENAFATCLLEHAEQIGAWKVLRPFLSGAAIEKSKA